MILTFFYEMVFFDCQIGDDSLHSTTHFFEAFRDGEMTEWLKVHAWKACVRKYREFESHSLRQYI